MRGKLEMDTKIVYTGVVLKNITLSAEESLLQKARARAAAERKSLNAVFRDWLARYARQGARLQSYRALMRQIGHVKTGGPFSRDEANAR